MILLLSIMGGAATGALRARLGGREFASPHLRRTWLVPVAFLPQWLAFVLPATRRLVTIDLAAAALITSQMMLLLFIWLNRQEPGFRFLAIGAVMNLTVIALNGGLMPISPDTVARLLPGASPDAWHIGARFGHSKDIILLASATRLEWLSDRFTLCAPVPPQWRGAFSLGDVMIAAGAFDALWTLGGGPQPMVRRNENVSLASIHRRFVRPW
jgi:hypothetical protein